LLGDSAAAGQLNPTSHSHDQLSAHQQHQPIQQRSAGWGQHCWTWASSWGVNDELQNIQAILQSSSSSSEILSER
jgi:hypothetical protein